MGWHLCRLFFEDYALWSLLTAPLAFPDDFSQFEYDRCFKGTDADLYVPLWASACVGNEDILLNEVTLEVIRCYRECGYSPVPMDGNPPDFIGQQCRFLEYLTVCRDKESGFSERAQMFISRFLAPTVRSMLSGLQERLRTVPQLRWLEAMLRGLILGEPSPELFPAGLTPWMLDSAHWNVNPPASPAPEQITTHASFCDCGSKCKTLARVQEGCVLSVFPDKSIPEKEFTCCSRGRSYRQTFLSSHRLRYPMERVGERGSGLFRRISWEEAAERIADSIRRTGKLYGPGSRFVTSASGESALVRGDRFVKHLLSIEGGYLQYYNSYSIACADAVLPYIYGTNVCGSAEEDLLNTKLLLLWGHNPADTLWGDKQLGILTELHRRGCRIIVIDPRRSETAKLFADQWIPIRPGTDAALADAMAFTILREGLQDQAFIDRFCLGFDEEHLPPDAPPGSSYRSYLFGEQDGIQRSPEWAESITGIRAESISALAREYASVKPACLLPGLGPQRTLCGEQSVRGQTALACLTGNVGRPGGGSGAYASRPGHTPPQFIPRESPYPGSIPTFLWSTAADRPEKLTCETGLRGAEALCGTKLIFNIASGILMNQHSNINDTIRILRDPEKVELIVVSDILMTPSARFADLLLPGVSFFEVENVVPPWTAADYLLYNEQAIEPLFGCRFEYEWVRMAARMLSVEEEFLSGRDALHDWVRELYEEHRAEETELPPFERFAEKGCHIYPAHPDYVAFRENIERGIPFATPSGKIEIYSGRLSRQHLPAVPGYTPCAEGVSDPLRSRFPLQLIGFHTKRRCHSIHENNPLLEHLEPRRLWIHPDDARERGLSDGSMAEIYNDRGSMLLAVLITEDIAPGVVALSEGAWFTPDADGRDLAGSINVLTMTEHSTPMAHGNPQHTNLVQVRLHQK